MAHKGWIESEWGTSENNRRAKFYRLTRKGRAQLEAKTRGWDRLVEAMRKALEAPRDPHAAGESA